MKQLCTLKHQENHTLGSPRLLMLLMQILNVDWSIQAMRFYLYHIPFMWSTNSIAMKRKKKTKTKCSSGASTAEEWERMQVEARRWWPRARARKSAHTEKSIHLKKSLAVNRDHTVGAYWAYSPIRCTIKDTELRCGLWHPISRSHRSKTTTIIIKILKKKTVWTDGIFFVFRFSFTNELMIYRCAHSWPPHSHQTSHTLVHIYTNLVCMRQV